MIDTHCHLADQTFVGELPNIITRAREAGLERALCILAAGDAGEMAQAKVVTELWPEVRYAVGIHPGVAHQHADPQRATEVVRTQIAQNPQVRAMGEMGLDYHYEFAARRVQEVVFRAQVRLAREMKLPVVIHTREAADDTLRVLKEDGAGEVTGVFHCFTGTATLAKAAVALGFYISFSGVLTFPRANDLREIARTLPLDRLLIETDSPYLAPLPHRGKPNEPSYLKHISVMLAKLHGLSQEELSAKLHENFETLFHP